MPPWRLSPSPRGPCRPPRRTRTDPRPRWRAISARGRPDPWPGRRWRMSRPPRRPRGGRRRGAQLLPAGPRLPQAPPPQPTTTTRRRRSRRRCRTAGTRRAAAARRRSAPQRSAWDPPASAPASGAKGRRRAAPVHAPPSIGCLPLGARPRRAPSGTAPPGLRAPRPPRRGRSGMMLCAPSARSPLRRPARASRQRLHRRAGSTPVRAGAC
mmetsp:Transcript_82195/g.211804  ORF Transcript_82195/g.211804 Transcript_82195/m.211804 type:complete len:211 (+) Transcript_82195:1839-2471(+)